MEPSTSRLLLLLAYLLVHLPGHVTAQPNLMLPNFTLQWCYDSANNFTNRSIYQTNLNNLLSSIANNTDNDSGFYNLTQGQSPDQVNLLALCRGDTSLDVCRSCIYNSTIKILEICPFRKEALGIYDLCMLRYSNNSVFGDPQTRPAFIAYNTGNASNMNTFSEEVRNLSIELRSAAASGNSIKKFATKEVLSSEFYTIYGLVQCTPDLSRNQCDDCLLSNFRDSLQFQGKLGGVVLGPSCQYRYEIYSFYSTQPSPPPQPSNPPQLAPPFASPPSEGKSGISTVTIVAIVTAVAGSIGLFCFVFYFLSRRRRRRNKYHPAQENNDDDEITTAECLQFDFETIERATEEFSENKKLGEGGFGEVYQGTLPNGQEVAVKRLSRGSGQGAGEFKNEVTVVAKLQHRNLVRLLGFCLEREEKILVYEYVPNKSLDYFLFDPEKRGLLDWSRRYKIIGGIARGILYLHEDSRLRIIHRDLKASNILLDADMNAKISDFGMARIFRVDQSQASTNRIVGTYGYMSPEYAMHGHFSVKSDAYSFGVLILEIITGHKNSSFYQRDGCADLLSYVWRHWRDGTPLVILDPALADTYSRNEVIRCIHIGLLCVQEDPTQRPAMATVILMLDSFSITLPVPQEPAFYYNSKTEGSLPVKELVGDESNSQSVPLSVDEDSSTQVYPR